MYLAELTMEITLAPSVVSVFLSVSSSSSSSRDLTCYWNAACRFLVGGASHLTKALHESKMADVQSCEKNAATESLQHYFSDLVVAIQDPVIAASELYSVKLISWTVADNASTLGLPKSVINFKLLSAIRSQLATNPSGIDILIQLLNAKLNLQEIAKKIEEKYRGEVVQSIPEKG